MAWIYLMSIICAFIKYVQAESCGSVNGSMLGNNSYGLHFQQSKFFKTNFKLRWIWKNKSGIIDELNDSNKYQKSPGKLKIQRVSSLNNGKYYVECWENDGTRYQSSHWSLEYGQTTQDPTSTKRSITKKQSVTTTLTSGNSKYQTTRVITTSTHTELSTSTSVIGSSPQSKDGTKTATIDEASSTTQPAPTTQIKHEALQTTTAKTIKAAVIHTESQSTIAQRSILTTEAQIDNHTLTDKDKTTTMYRNDKVGTLSHTSIIMIVSSAVVVTLIVSITVCLSIRARKNEILSVSNGFNQPYVHYSTVNRPRYRNTTTGNSPAQYTVAEPHASVNIEPHIGLRGTCEQSSLTANMLHHTTVLNETNVPQSTPRGCNVSEGPVPMTFINAERHPSVQYSTPIPSHKRDADYGNNAQTSVPGHNVNTNNTQIGPNSFSSPSNVHYASVKRSLHPKPSIANHFDSVTTGQFSQQAASLATGDQQVPELHYADLDLPGPSRDITQIRKDNSISKCHYAAVDVHKIP